MRIAPWCGNSPIGFYALKTHGPLGRSGSWPCGYRWVRRPPTTRSVPGRAGRAFIRRVLVGNHHSSRDFMVERVGHRVGVSVAFWDLVGKKNWLLYIVCNAHVWPDVDRREQRSWWTIPRDNDCPREQLTRIYGVWQLEGTPTDLQMAQGSDLPI